MKSSQDLHPTHRRITKAGCCEKWRKFENFQTWYQRQAKEQKDRCYYCHLPGDTEKYYHQHFRPDKNRHYKRGLNLEVDRKDNNEPYSPSNCVLACYPCNNAKSDVFSYDEFVEIGRMIGKIKKRS